MPEEKMPQTPSRARRIAKVAAIVLLAAALGVIYLASTHKLRRTAPAQHEAALAAHPAERKPLYWYDPMHPAYKSDKPGIAPDCGMALVPKYADEEKSAPAAGSVTLDANKQSMAGVRTTLVERRPLMREITTTAQIVADETRV